MIENVKKEFLYTGNNNEKIIIKYKFDKQAESWRFDEIVFSFNGPYTINELIALKDVISIIERFEKQIKKDNEPLICNGEVQDIL